MKKAKKKKKKKTKNNKIFTMNISAKTKMLKELAGAGNMVEVFRIFEKYYDLENCRPGAITKAGLISQLDKAVIALNAKPKKIYQ